MKTEVRFKDEWRVFHVLKSAFENSLQTILETIPDFEKPNLMSSSIASSSFSREQFESQAHQSNLNFNNIDGISATAGPGLIVCLTVGLNAGKAIAGSLKKPFVAVNHLEGHALSPGLENKIEFPYLLLLISGGHTQYLIVKDINHYEQLGTTIDDALGEAFDKTAKMLDLGYPGGPAVEKFSKLGEKNYFKLPAARIRAATTLPFGNAH